MNLLPSECRPSYLVRPRPGEELHCEQHNRLSRRLDQFERAIPRYDTGATRVWVSADSVRSCGSISEARLPVCLYCSSSGRATCKKRPVRSASRRSSSPISVASSERRLGNLKITKSLQQIASEREREHAETRVIGRRIGEFKARARMRESNLYLRCASTLEPSSAYKSGHAGFFNMLR